MERGNDAVSTQLRLDPRLAKLAARQHGLFSREQVTALGGTKDIVRRRLDSERWEQVEARVFRLAGAPGSVWQSLMVACLAWGDGAAASHRAGGALWNINGFKPVTVELTVPRERRRDGPGVVHRGLLLPADVTVIHGIPVTKPDRTLIDIASVCPRDLVEEALDDALRQGLVSIPRLRWLLSQRSQGRPGISMMRALIAERDPNPVTQSRFETMLLRLMRQSGLREVVRQHEIRSGGRLIARVDFAFPDHRLAIEADGYAWHSGRAQWQRDRSRDNQLTLLGWRVIHVTWSDFRNHPAAVIASIKEALGIPIQIPSGD